MQVGASRAGVVMNERPCRRQCRTCGWGGTPGGRQPAQDPRWQPALPHQGPRGPQNTDRAGGAALLFLCFGSFSWRRDTRQGQVPIAGAAPEAVSGRRKGFCPL